MYGTGISGYQRPDDLVLSYLTGDCLTWSLLQKELKSV
jgi:hypothetical protein